MNQAQEEIKKEIRDYYAKLEKNGDQYYYMLPFFTFQVEEEPEKYGYYDNKNETLNILNVAKCEKLKKEGKEEEAIELRKKFLDEHRATEPPKYKAQKDRFNLSIHSKEYKQ